MNRRHKFNLLLRSMATARTVNARHAIVFVLLVFFLLSSAWVFNLCSLEINRFSDDEIHTLVFGTRTLSPWGKAVPTARVGETNRWFVRFLYPFGVYYMNSQMGGEHCQTGWDYPGGYYLREHFERIDAVQHDPNIQDYVFFLRLAFGVMAVCSFCLVIWALFSRFGFAAAAAYGSLILASSLVFLQFRFFYSETTLFLIFNTAAFLCLRARTPTHRTAALLGILSAAALSAKLTGVMIVGPVLVYMVVNAWGQRHKANIRIETYLLFAAAFLFSINLYSESLFSFLNETLANVYHYKTGHSITREGGVKFLLKIFDDVGYPVVLLFAASLSWLAKSPKRQLVPAYVLGIILVFVIWSLSNSAVYLNRNLASVYVAMSFIVALGVGSFVRNWKYKNVLEWILALVFVWLTGRIVYEMPSLNRTFWERNAERIEACSSIGAIGLSKKDLQAFDEKEAVVVFDQVRGPFNISQDSQKFEKYLKYDCLVVCRKGQSKQISNFFAPQRYRLSDRVGNLFFFELKN